MKNLVFAILCSCVLKNLHSQSVNLAFNSTRAGRNVTVQYELVKENHEWSFGLGVNINKMAHNDDQGNVYKKRMFATEPLHYLNLNATYQRYIFTGLKGCIKPFVFYDVQAKYSPTRNRFFLPVGIDSTNFQNDPEGSILYKEFIRSYGPFFWLENNIGIGFKAQITEQWYIKQRFGVGLMFTIGDDDLLADRIDSRVNWEFAELLHFGVGMNIR
jgi:hypothetical protein